MYCCKMTRVLHFTRSKAIRMGASRHVGQKSGLQVVSDDLSGGELIQPQIPIEQMKKLRIIESKTPQAIQEQSKKKKKKYIFF